MRFVHAERLRVCKLPLELAQFEAEVKAQCSEGHRALETK